MAIVETQGVKMRSRRWLVGFLILLAGLLGVGIGLFTNLRPATSPPAERSSELSPEQARRTGASPNAALPSERSEAPPSNAVSDTATPVARSIAEVTSLLVRCVSSTGAAVPGVSVSCVVTSGDPRSRAGNHLFVAQFNRTSDVNGEFSLESNPQHWAQLSLKSSHYYSKGAIVPFLQRGSVYLLVSPLLDVRIRAIYDDGQPVASTGLFSRPADPMAAARRPEALANWYFKLSRDGTATVTVPSDEPLQCRIDAQVRAGYLKHSQVFSVAELDSGQELQIIVGRHVGTPAGTIRVEWGSAGTEWNLIVEGGGLGVRNEVRVDAGQTGVDVWPLAPGIYRVQLSTRGGARGAVALAWRSEPIELKARETVVVSAKPEPTATVKARLVDESAFAIRGGTLRISNGQYLQFKKGAPGGSPLPKGVLSDPSGNLTLTGLPSGKYQLEAEAWGKEPALFEVNLQPGDVIDVGNIMLRNAAGEVTVELSGMQEGLEYSVFVGRADTGGNIYPAIPVEGGRIVLSKLPVRAYQISAVLRGGGAVSAVRVELTPDQPSQSIRIDVQKLKPAKSPFE